MSNSRFAKDHKFYLTHEGWNCEPLICNVVTHLTRVAKRIMIYMPYGSVGYVINCIACKRCAVQTLMWSLKFVILNKYWTWLHSSFKNDPFLNSTLIILREDEIGIQVKYSSKVYGKECLILVAHKFLFSLERLS